MLEILGEIDGGHAALAELALDAVAIGEGGREPFGQLSHGDSLPRRPAGGEGTRRRC